MWRGMRGRQELRDAHAKVAVHPVGDDLPAVIVELDVGEGTTVAA